MVRTCSLNNYSDVHYTPAWVAQKVVSFYKPTGKCLEPFAGDGAFLDCLPANSDWCEIAEGRDFFDYTTPVDWIVTNPPFSNLTEIFKHSFKLADNCVFVIPISKYWSSAPRLELVRNYGGLKGILHLGTGRAIGFNIGFPFAALHFERGYKGPIFESKL